MLSPAVQDALNEQVNHEFESAYIYLSMAAYCDSINLPGAAHWMRLQWQEELTHATKLFDFISDRGGRALLKAIPQPPTEFGSALEVFETALGHERKITALINQLYDLAVRERDYPTQSLLQWFVNEQVEEEKSATEVVEKLRLIGEQGAMLFMLDQQLAARQAEAGA
ncbi:MAG TPA: ferritin [Herpetosiphonaceae bacterium]